MKFSMRLDQALLSRAIKSAARKKMLCGAVIAAILVAVVCALPVSAARLGIVKKSAAEEGLAELGKHEVARSVNKRLYWGRLVAAENPRLTKFEINEIGRAILKYSGEHNLSPEIIVAIIKVESSGRPSAVSPVGAQGLMQVMPFWKDELGIEGSLFDIDNNINAGTRILAGYIKRYGYREGIARYYRGSMPVSAEGYYGKVQKAMQI